MYPLLFRLIISHLDPEFSHHLGAAVLKFWPRRFRNTPQDAVKRMGITFPNRLGVAAGFDKNAKLVLPLTRLGFGFVEIGTVTAEPQQGNPKPRMFRLTGHRSLINRMGFNNDGAAAVASHLRALRNKRQGVVIGVNLGKNKEVANEDAAENYLQSLRLLKDLADYVVLNVSSPNTPNLRALQAVAELKILVDAVRTESGQLPLLIKIAPDLNDADILEIADFIESENLAGVIATNTTISRAAVADQEQHKHEAGGLSGPLLAERSLAVLKLLRTRLDERFTIISVGGIETAADAVERLAAGADLVQGYTSFVYEGPSWPSRIVRGLRNQNFTQR